MLRWFSRSVTVLPRDLHPGAWWVWAICAAASASMTSNVWLLALAVTAVVVVTMARRPDAPWARSFRMYVWVAGVILTIRVVFRILLGGNGNTVILDLPYIPLPYWVAGISLLGPLSAEALLAAFFDGARLATIVLCVGAANSLANPKRMLKHLPSALYEVGTAVVVALTVFPQLGESVHRVRRARRLRGDTAKGKKALVGIIIPVLEDALDRSIALAASMDARGYGRSGTASRRQRLVTGTLLVTGLLGMCVGVYLFVDPSADRGPTGRLVLGAGVLVCAAGFLVSGCRVTASTYRPERWWPPEVLTVLCGLVSLAVLWHAKGADPVNVNPPISGLTLPGLPVVPLLGMLLLVLPAFLTPVPDPLHAPDPADVEADAAAAEIRAHQIVEDPS